MNLPKRPACFRQHGVIRCECSAWNPKERNDCISSREFWHAAEVVANLADNTNRHNYIAMVGSTKGPVAADRLKSAAKELMRDNSGIKPGRQRTAGS